MLLDVPDMLDVLLDVSYMLDVSNSLLNPFIV